MPFEVLIVAPEDTGSVQAMRSGLSQANTNGPRWQLGVDFRGRSLRDPRWLDDGAWRGVISWGVTQALRSYCAVRGLPLVVIGPHPPDRSMAVVCSDFAAVGRRAVRLSSAWGRSVIGYCGIIGDAVCARNRAAVQHAGSRVPGHRPSALVLPPPATTDLIAAHAQIRTIASWLRQLPAAPSMVITTSASRAQQVILAAGLAERRIPEDVSVLALSSDAPGCATAVPGIDRLDTGAAQMGALAVVTLARWLAGPPAGGSLQVVAPQAFVALGSTQSVRPDHPWIVQSLALIAQRRGQLTIGELLQHTGATRMQLEHAFRRQLGRSPQQEIRRCRAEQISHWLETSNEPLAAIAIRTGFKHVEYLSVFFKRETGLSPRVHRQRHGGANSSARFPAPAPGDHPRAAPGA